MAWSPAPPAVGAGRDCAEQVVESGSRGDCVVGGAKSNERDAVRVFRLVNMASRISP